MISQFYLHTHTFICSRNDLAYCTTSNLTIGSSRVISEVVRKDPLRYVLLPVVVEIFAHVAVKATVTNAPQSQLNK